MTGNPLDAAPPDILEFLREEGIRAVEELFAGNDDRVDGSPASGGKLPEHLSNQSLSSVTLHRSAYLSRSDDAEAGTTARGWQQQQCEETALKAGATIENLLKLGAASNAALARKAIGRPGAAGVRRLHYRAPASALPLSAGLFRRNRQALAALGPTALQHEAPLLRGHAHEESVRATAAPVVWLKSAFAFHMSGPL